MKIEINNGIFKLNDKVIFYEEEVEENYTLKDLKQKLINYLYIKNEYSLEDIILIQILFETKKD